MGIHGKNLSQSNQGIRFLNVRISETHFAMLSTVGLGTTPEKFASTS